MKIISWNVNGMRAAWGYGLATFIKDCNADIVALQETKLTEPYLLAEKEGYETYWNFCDNRVGYSGTVLFTKIQPISVANDIGNRDVKTEGRIITLEFETFYLINCYFPSALRSYYRKDYRNEWDKAFIEYINILKCQKKSIIICGDLNVVVFEEENKEKFIFQSDEQTNLIQLINNGFVDAYRHLYPDKQDAFTWWSHKNNKRQSNVGRRLDYFIISEDISTQITDCGMLTHVKGSDHCPIFLNIDLDEENKNRRASKWDYKLTYKDLLLIQEQRISLSELRFSNLGSLWDSVDWKQAETHLAGMQAALAKSVHTGSKSLITRWQKNIVFSIDAKLLAIRSVCNNSGIVGVDGIKWTTSYEKMAAALSLSTKDYTAMPARLILVNTKNGRQRKIRIDTYYDRAIQTLYSYALDPIAESTGDRNSYAYRKGRSAYDINARIIEAFSGDDAPEWVLLADVKACYASICHEWILNNIPMPPTLLKEYLKSGFIFDGKLYQPDVGIGIGEPLSPIIANMVLDGMQSYVYSKLYPVGEIDYCDGCLFRYADDIIVAAKSMETALRAKEYIQLFLHKRGLELSEDKTIITHISKGFDFMKRTYEKDGTKLFAKPSKAAIERFMGDVKGIIENYIGSQKSLIDTLNRKIDGWITYHKVTDARVAFTEIDVFISGLLLDLCKSKHPKWSMEKIFEKYWYKDHEGNWYCTLPNNREIRVKHMSDTLFYQYIPIKTSVNPYTDVAYLDKRKARRSIESMTGIYRAIWTNQDGKCYYCGKQILVDEEKILVDIDGSQPSIVKRKAYIHKRCADGSLEYIDTEIAPATLNELRDLLTKIESQKWINSQKYYLLSEFFRTCDKSSVTLTFGQIEEIMGDKLGLSALHHQFWYRTGFSSISQCWLNHGYEIKALHLEGKKRVTFRLGLENRNTSSIVLPTALKYQRIPVAAKYEIENFFQFIIKKYGL